MTPADLAELLKTTAAAVLAEHDLDPAALPATVTVERPRNPEHGDYATNLALQLGKKVGVNPRELAGWLAEALAATDGIASAEVAGPGFVNLRLEASAQGVIVDNVIDAGARVRPLGRPRRPERQPGVRLGQPDRTDPYRRHPLGRGRRRARPVAGHPGRRGHPRVLLQRPRRADRPLRPLAGRRGQGRAHAGGRIRGRATSPISPPRSLASAPEALSAARRTAAGDVPRDRRRADVRPDQASLHEFGTDFDVYTHEDSMHTSGRVEQAIAQLRKSRQHLRQGRRDLVAHHRIRRRQGPRRHQERRPTRLHRRRPRLLPGQARTRLRPVHLHARRRPPRLHRPAEGRRGRRWATTPTPSRC